MKKILSFLAIAMIMMGLSACSGGGGASNPEDAVKNYLKAMKNADVKALVAASCYRDGTLYDISKEDPDDLKRLETELQAYSGLDYTITDVKIDGHIVRVKVNVKIMGVDKTFRLKSIRCTDDKWRISDLDIIDD